MDPGNWATNVAGGSAFGYELLSVVLLSGAMALVLQHLSAKLGIATGEDLAAQCRRNFAPSTVVALWALSEVAICACDLAEVLGTAIAVNLLTGLPLVYGVFLTGFGVLVAVQLERMGARWLEAAILATTAVVAVCLGIELVLCRPDPAAIARGLLPSPHLFGDAGMLYLACGILGATVMPHNLYLHSSLVRRRAPGRDPAAKRAAIRFAGLDTGLSLVLATLVNGAILIIAAAAFHAAGRTDIAELKDAYLLLTPLLGAPAAGTIFALGLLASGQNSSITATMAGQVVMEGFLDLRMPPWARRLVTRGLAILPALVAVGWWGGAGATQLLVLSQVVLSVQLPFAAVPLVFFTGDRRRMGTFANTRGTALVAWSIVGVLIALNLFLAGKVLVELV
jgi:manganese transport protein